MRAALIALSLVSFLNMNAAGAEAQVSPDWTRHALETAQRVWHPGCGQLRVEWGDPAAFGGNETWGGWAYAGDCTIHEPARPVWFGYPDFCTAVLHEAGHAAGMGHSDRGVMRPEMDVTRTEAMIRGRTVVRWTGVDRRCLRNRNHVLG